MRKTQHSSRQFDPPLREIVDYCYFEHAFTDTVLSHARYALMDATSCAMASLQDAYCLQHLGTLYASDAPMEYCRDPAQDAYNIACLVRWLDYNDTWLAQEWGHPSDNLGAVLACAEYRNRHLGGLLTMRDVLCALVLAYEIQGVLALGNSFNQRGFDHVILVRIASTALAVKMLGGDREQMLNALSNAFLDGVSLRTYRHAPNTGWRKSWAAADAGRRGVQLAQLALRGEMGYASALSAPIWGFNAVILNGDELLRKQPYAHYVIDNILYKIAYPVEFHAQTAVECAVRLHHTFQSTYACDIDCIDRIDIHTQHAAMRIINKSGPLSNPADRDHCLQFAVATALLTGNLQSEDYQDDHPRAEQIDRLREKMTLAEDHQFTQDYHAPDKRAIANRIDITYHDGQTATQHAAYPLGHPRRRAEAEPLLREKFSTHCATVFTEEKTQTLLALFADADKLMAMPTHTWMEQCFIAHHSSLA